MASVVVRWPVLVVYDPDDLELLEVWLALVVCVDPDVVGTVVARVVVRWPVLVVYDPDDPELLEVWLVLVVCVDPDVTGMVVV